MTKKIYIAIFMSFIFSTPSISFADQYPSFAKKLYTYHESSVEFVPAFLMSVLNFSKLISGKDDISPFLKDGSSLKPKYEKMEVAYKSLEELYKNNKNNLNKVDTIMESLYKEVSENNMDQLNKYVNGIDSLVTESKDEKFTVYANEGWANTGINVKDGDLIFIRANGSWFVSSSYPEVDWRGFGDSQLSNYALTNEAPMGALIYRVRGGTNPNGSGFDKNMVGHITGTGRLEMTINDRDLANNKGQIDVEMLIVDISTFTNIIEALKGLNDKTPQN